MEALQEMEKHYSILENELKSLESKYESYLDDCRYDGILPIFENESYETIQEKFQEYSFIMNHKHDRDDDVLSGLGNIFSKKYRDVDWTAISDQYDDHVAQYKSKYKKCQ